MAPMESGGCGKAKRHKSCAYRKGLLGWCAVSGFLESYMGSLWREGQEELLRMVMVEKADIGCLWKRIHPNVNCEIGENARMAIWSMQCYRFFSEIRDPFWAFLVLERCSVTTNI